MSDLTSDDEEYVLGSSSDEDEDGTSDESDLDSDSDDSDDDDNREAGNVLDTLGLPNLCDGDGEGGGGCLLMTLINSLASSPEPSSRKRKMAAASTQATKKQKKKQKAAVCTTRKKKQIPIPQELCPKDWKSLVFLVKYADRQKKNFVHCEKLMQAKKELLALDQFVGQLQFKNFLASSIMSALASGTTNLRHFRTHWVIEGKPGSGKTTMIQLVANLLQALSLLKHNNVVHADRQSLVAEYVGQTAKKTKRAVKKSLGGILVLDECYNLCADDSYSQVCLDTLNELLSKYENQFLCVFIGYNDTMQILCNRNQGIKRRIGYRVTMESYSHSQLAKMVLYQIAMQKHVKVDESVDVKFLTSLVKSNASKWQHIGGSIRHCVLQLVAKLEKESFGKASSGKLIIKRDDIRSFISGFDSDKKDDGILHHMYL